MSRQTTPFAAQGVPPDLFDHAKKRNSPGDPSLGRRRTVSPPGKFGSTKTEDVVGKGNPIIGALLLVTLAKFSDVPSSAITPG